MADVDHECAKGPKLNVVDEVPTRGVRWLHCMLSSSYFRCIRRVRPSDHGSRLVPSFLSGGPSGC